MEKYIKGTYKKNIFSSDSGYVVGILKVKETNDDSLKEYVDRQLTFTGYFSDIRIDENYILYGDMVDHSKYGLQYYVQKSELIKPEDKDGIIAFLSSNLFKGIGEQVAKNVVETLGKDTLNRILTEDGCLNLVPNLSQKKAIVIYETLKKYEESHQTIVYLNELGFSMKESLMIYNKYKNDTIHRLKFDIYSISNDLEEISFLKVDKISVNLDIGYDDERRIKACILYQIGKVISTQGDTYVSYDDIKEKTTKYLGFLIEDTDFILYLDELRYNGYIVKEDNVYYLKKIYDAEQDIVNKVKILLSIPKYTNKKFDVYLKELESQSNVIYNERQKQAIKASLSNHLTIITGGPGTGKTTIIKAIVDMYVKIFSVTQDQLDVDVALLAPTGRASKRMSESTNLKAMTIHRFLKWNKDTNRFSINEFNKASSKLVIIDEASMVDLLLLQNLFLGLNDDIRVVIVGDFNQLPSVGAGQVLKDFIESNTIDVVELETLYRQSDDSYIISLAREINQNKISNENFPKKSDFLFLKCEKDLIADNIISVAKMLKEKGYDLKKFQFMAPMYAGVNGVDMLNKKMQEVFNEKDSSKNEIVYGDVIYRENDKVIQLVNMPDLNVFNGDVGIIKSIIDAKKSSNKKIEIWIDFEGNLVVYEFKDLQKIKHAYIISIHKSQGSEFEIVVMPVCMSYYRMLYRKLLYTAITRAKKKLILVGEVRAFLYGIKNENEYVRKTRLKEKLIDSMNN